MRERDLERALVRAVSGQGGLALKFVSPGLAGVPDRLVLLPEGRMSFVELKAPGKKPAPQQLLRHRQLRALGFRVFVIDSKDQIQNLLSIVGNDSEGGLEGVCTTVSGGDSVVGQTLNKRKALQGEE